MTTVPLQTLLAAIPSRVIAVLRDHEHSADDLVRHLIFCYAMLPTTPREIQFDEADQNHLCREFRRDYCGEDGAVNWEKLLALNIGTGVEAQGLPATGTPRTDAVVQAVFKELSPVNPALREHAELLERELSEISELASGLKADLERYPGLAGQIGAKSAVSERDAALAELATLRRKVKAAEGMAAVLEEIAAMDTGEQECIATDASEALSAWQEANKP